MDLKFLIICRQCRDKAVSRLGHVPLLRLTCPLNIPCTLHLVKYPISNFTFLLNELLGNYSCMV